MNNYLFVCSRKTFDIAQEKGVIGFHDYASTLNNEFSKMNVGDRIFFYITKEKVLGGYARVSKTVYLDGTKIYDQFEELCVRRIGVKVLSSQKADFLKLVPNLNFIKKKKGVVWSAYLVKNLITLNEHDTKLLEDNLD